MSLKTLLKNLGTDSPITKYSPKLKRLALCFLIVKFIVDCEMQLSLDVNLLHIYVYEGVGPLTNVISRNLLHICVYEGVGPLTDVISRKPFDYIILYYVYAHL